MQLKVRKVGNSLGVDSPAGGRRAAQGRRGRSAQSDRGADDYRLSAYDPEIARADRGRREDHGSISQHAARTGEVNVEWIAYETVLIFHDTQIAEHGGRHGLRDEGVLDRRLRGRRTWLPMASPTVFELAAAYA